LIEMISNEIDIREFIM